MTIEQIALVALFTHQTLDIVGVKGYVSRPELMSPDTIGWGLFAVLLVLYFLGFPYINFIFILLFGLVSFGLYHFHWKFYWFGASDKKIKGYNEYFVNTHRLLPESATRVVPDTYHIIHSILYLSTFILILFNAMKAFM